MGVELHGYDLAVSVAEDGYLSDSEAFASVINVIDGVRMVRSHIDLFYEIFCYNIS